VSSVASTMRIRGIGASGQDRSCRYGLNLVVCIFNICDSLPSLSAIIVAESNLVFREEGIRDRTQRGALRVSKTLTREYGGARTTCCVLSSPQPASVHRASVRDITDKPLTTSGASPIPTNPR